MATERPPTGALRIVIAVVGLILSLVLLNVGFNLIGEDNEPVPPTGGSTRGTTAGTLPPATMPPATAVPGTTITR